MRGFKCLDKQKRKCMRNFMTLAWKSGQGNYVNFRPTVYGRMQSSNGFARNLRMRKGKGGCASPHRPLFIQAYKGAKDIIIMTKTKLEEACMISSATYPPRYGISF